MDNNQPAQSEQQETSEVQIQTNYPTILSASNIHLYHSDPNKQPTRRRYSAGGRVVQTSEGYFLEITYAVCSLKDDFSKTIATKIVTGRLTKQSKVSKVVTTPITEEQAQHPAALVRDFAVQNIPLVAFHNKVQKHILTMMKQQDVLDGTQSAEYNTNMIMVKLPSKEEVEAMDAEQAKDQQIKQGIQALGEAMQALNNQPTAEA